MKRFLGIFGVGVLLLVVNIEASVNSNRNFWKLPWGSYDQASPASGSDDLTFDGSGFDKDDKVTSGVHEDDEDYDGGSGDNIIDLTPDDDDDDDDDDTKKDDDYYYEDKDDKKNKPSDDEDDEDLFDGSGSGDESAPVEEVIVPDQVGGVDAKKPTTLAPKKQLTPCENLNKQGKMVDASFIPECDDEGAFKREQCMIDAGTNKKNCWCVDPWGIEIKGTRMVEPRVPGCRFGENLSPCVQKLVRNSQGLLGAFKPVCTEEGEYESVQCHGSECWCVDAKGNQIVGTDTNLPDKPTCPTGSKVVDKPNKPDNTVNIAKPDDGYTVSGDTKEDIDNVVINMRPVEVNPEEENTFDESKEEETNEISESYATIKQNEAILRQPGLLAAIIGGAVVGLLCMVLLVMFIVYRMRKKDEGSYPLDEQKYQNYSYTKAPDKEFYA